MAPQAAARALQVGTLSHMKTPQGAVPCPGNSLTPMYPDRCGHSEEGRAPWVPTAEPAQEWGGPGAAQEPGSGTLSGCGPPAMVPCFGFHTALAKPSTASNSQAEAFSRGVSSTCPGAHPYLADWASVATWWLMAHMGGHQPVASPPLLAGVS